jgi:hypothetical protein
MATVMGHEGKELVKQVIILIKIYTSIYQNIM